MTCALSQVTVPYPQVGFTTQLNVTANSLYFLFSTNKAPRQQNTYCSHRTNNIRVTETILSTRVVTYVGKCCTKVLVTRTYSGILFPLKCTYPRCREVRHVALPLALRCADAPVTFLHSSCSISLAVMGRHYRHLFQ